MNKKTSKKSIVENYILEEIEKGALKIGDQIPPEYKFVEKFGFARQTIHDCLKTLANKGIIERIPGKGSFVIGKPINRNIAHKMSFSEDMYSIGMKPGSELLEFRLTKANEYPQIVKLLKIDGEEKIYYISRLRTGDKLPIVLQYHYTPYKYIGDINLAALEGSFDKYIDDKGINVTGFLTKLKAVEASDAQLSLLQSNSKALLKSVSIRFIDDKIPFQCTESFYRSDLFEYTFSSF